MKLKEFKTILGYFVEESKEHLNTLYQGFINLQNTIDDREELESLFRATFSLKGGTAMLGFTTMYKVVCRLEDCLKFLRYPIIADETIELLFLDVYHILNNLIIQVETAQGLTLEKLFDITVNVKSIFTLLHSHLLFLIDRSNYKAKINSIDSSIQWSYHIPLKLVLLDTRPFLCRAFKDYFDGLPNVEIVNVSFQELPFFDCIVTAASSISHHHDVDSQILNFFGEDVVDLLQKRIYTEYLGDQPIGTSLIVETNHPLHPFLAHTPSLRMDIARAGRDHVYHAMWSTFLAIRKHNQLHSHCLHKQINIVAVPGLGTAYGRVSVDEVARQMCMAYQNFLYSSYRSSVVSC